VRGVLRDDPAARAEAMTILHGSRGVSWPSAHHRGALVAKLSPGDKAPAFTLPDAEGNKTSLSSFAGKKVVVYFYP
jgi:cytochrome oxidase Cu insertion factor (SCO1/SenC/PrrC family)